MIEKVLLMIIVTIKQRNKKLSKEEYVKGLLNGKYAD
jgi:hypothetical protein